MIDDNQLVSSLLEQGFLDQATLQEGLAKTKQSGRSLYETLIAHEMVTESALVGVVSDILNVPSQEVDPDSIPEDVRSLVPASMARRNRVLPLELSNGELVLGMVDPIDVLAMDEIATHTGIDIRPVLVGPATIAGAIHAMYGEKESTSDLAEEVMASFDDFDVAGMMDEVMAGDEWSDLFEDGEDGPSVEDSAVLSMEMRDRPSTDVLAEEDLEESGPVPEAAEVSEEPEEEELPEIEIIEELGKPIEKSTPPDPYADLDKWEVDEALTSNKKIGDSEILSAASAHELFSTSPARGSAMVDAEPLPDDTNLVETSSVDSGNLSDTQSSKTSIGVGVDQLSADAGQIDASPETGNLEATGRTALGVGPMLGDDTGATGELEAEAAAEEPVEDKSVEESTDYGALGRAILKTKPTSDATTDSSETPREESEDEDAPAAVEAGDTNVAEPADPERKTDPDANAELEAPAEIADAPATDIISGAAVDQMEHADPSSPEDDQEEEQVEDHVEEQVDEIEEPVADEPISAEEEQEQVEEASEPVVSSPSSDASDEMAVEPIDAAADRKTQEDALTPEVAESTRPRLASPALALPEGIDSEGLALALANLLINKGILTTEEVFKLAHHLSSSPKNTKK